MTHLNFPRKSTSDVLQLLKNKQEIALIDVREEALFAEAHPLFAVNISLSKLEIEILNRVLHLNTLIVLYDNGEGDAERAAQRLDQLGYQQIFLLEGQLKGWQTAGGELFKDVNVPSKAFGELVEHFKQTPSLSAEEIKQRLETEQNLIIVDARRFDEYQTMNIPSSISVPGAELVLRAPYLAPDPNTEIIVNCAGRTRSIIGTQSLVNAGIPNPVYALRNGTIGWTLAGFELEREQNRQFTEISNQQRQSASKQAQQVAERAGVESVSYPQLQDWLADSSRTTYLFDVRTTTEYETGHLAQSRSTPGGQLVQETDHFAAVRGARIVLADSPDLTRAYMTASWLKQMGWETYVLTEVDETQFNHTGTWQPKIPHVSVKSISIQRLHEWQQQSLSTLVLDVTSRANYLKQHIEGAWYILRGQILKDIHHIPAWQNSQQIVITCGTSLLAQFAAAELQQHTDIPVYILEGGSQAWYQANLPISHHAQLASAPIDRYRRPYEGTDNSEQAMQAYLDWEYGLVQQLENDGTHGFYVI